MTTELKCEIKNAQGAAVGSLELDASVFGAKPNKDAVFLAVRQRLAGRRAGTASTLSRSMMKGGGKKPWKQKGTGRARAGSGISPVWVGGAVVFGPSPRKYNFKLNKEHKRRAIVSVLSERAKNNALVVVDTLRLEEAKSKVAQQMLANLKLTDKSVLVVFSKEDQDMEANVKAFRNLPNAKVCLAEALNVYDVLDHEALVCSQTAVKDITERCKDCCACSCACN